MASQAAPLPQRANLASADRASGSQTVLSTHAEEGQHGNPEPILQPVLRLRGASISQPPAQRRTPTIRWADDVVDNEGMGRKSSKVCCIWHAPRAIDESSDESSSDSSSSSDDSDSDSELDRARPTGRRRAARLPHDHDHEGNCDHEHGHEHGENSESAKGKNKSSDAKKKRRRSPNAYERIPKPKLKGKGGSVTVTMDEQ